MKTTRPETLPVTENKRRRDRRLEDVILNIMRRHGCRMKLWVIASQAIDELRNSDDYVVGTSLLTFRSASLALQRMKRRGLVYVITGRYWNLTVKGAHRSVSDALSD